MMPEIQVGDTVVLCEGPDRGTVCQVKKRKVQVAFPIVKRFWVDRIRLEWMLGERRYKVGKWLLRP